MTDGRILRDRQSERLATSDRLASHAELGSVAILGQTKLVASYPTKVQAFFACSPMEVDGAESEGAIATFAIDASRTIYALNLGTQIPPVGSQVILHSCGGRWTFRYDG
ncbi:hypothetical protein [Aquisphaera insulae]|uniref:hypothetical protein n=1 Tax=Aquisphaera insulae TaxID=2712864 RepID=UPI0013ED4444|nr:hypothetical protein [Aquisphaera insulae]